jgi:outer membrane immunogenic protein
MKKIMLAAVAAFVLISVQNSQAQIGLGAGLAYGTEIENIGIQLGGTYVINEDFRAAVDIIYYFPKEEEGGFVETKWFEFNANAHYIFFQDDSMNAYAIGGLNYTSLTVDVEIPGFGSASASDGEVGLNLGIGAMIDVGFSNLYGEAKYVLGNADQLSIAVGLRFAL